MKLNLEQGRFYTYHVLWSDPDRRKHRLHVLSPKLKRHENYERMVPLFPEVADELRKLLSIPGNEDQEYVINRYPNRARSNMGMMFDRIAKRAGIDEKIPRPFDNLRASRSKEIRNKHGSEVESAWIGHSVEIAEEYYDMVTDDDYSIATSERSLTPVVEQIPEVIAGISRGVGFASAFTSPIPFYCQNY